MNADEFHRIHESYELVWPGKRDADEYRKRVATEQRDSFILHNAEGTCVHKMLLNIGNR